MFKTMDLGAIQGNPLQQYRNRLTSRICFQDDPPPPPVITADGWKEQLGEIGSHPSLASFSDNAEGLLNVAKSHVNVQPMIGLDKIPIPGKDSPPEIRRQAFHKLGLPEKQEDYKYERPGLPEGYPMNDELEGKLVAKAFEVGILPDQLKAIFDVYYDEAGKDFVALSEQSQADMDKMDAALRRKYGRAYEQNAAMADKVITQFADDQFKTFLEDSGLGNHPAMVDFLVTVGKSISPDTLVGAPRMTFKSPAEAQAEITRLYADEDFMKQYNNKDNPGHEAAVNRMYALQEAANPEGE